MRIICLAALSTISLPAVAQETYWVANRASNDIMEVTPWGSVLRRIDMGTSLRSAHVAPDGNIWVVRFIQSTVDIVDAATGTINSISFSQGSAYDIAFDDQGTAWVSGGSGVGQFAANGTSIQSIPLSQSAPLGITIDSLGNKWIAHRTPSGSVSRIDPAGVVTNYPVSGSNPVRPTADFRGLTMASHIWVTCDSGGSLLELDENGVELANYALPSTQIGGIGPVFDNNGDIWVGSYGNGDLYQVDPATGSVLNTYSIAPRVNGLSVDSLGRILCAQRITFSGVGPPCEVKRVDPATGTVEVPTILEFGGLGATGTQSAVSTPYSYSLVVAPFGDMDGDGEVNFVEVQQGTSPTDPNSNGEFSVATTGVSSIGSTPSLDALTPPSTIWVLGFAGGLVDPPVPVPGFAGELVLDASLLAGTVFGVGPSSLPIAIANTASLQGVELFTQAVILTAVAPGLELRNVSGIEVW